jgi:hypothetical protein
LLYYVTYFCDEQIIAERGPTLLRPHKDDLVIFPENGDAYVSEVFTVEDVCIIVPESDAEVVKVDVQLKANN